jgi:molybdate transport system regulatory protein
MPADAPQLKIKIQLYCGEEIAMGPGKADLLDAIAAAGSISGAARRLGMSYRRAWLLVDAMNRCWQEPLISATAGGASRQGAQITAFGGKVLMDYRHLQKLVTAARQGAAWQELTIAMRPMPLVRQQRGAPSPV